MSSGAGFTIFCNIPLPPAARDQLVAGLAQDRLVWAESMAPTNLFTGKPDPALVGAEIAFGQPEANQCASLPGLRYVHLSSAGYTPFDPPAIRNAFAGRAAILCNSSSVFSEPCAQHVLALMLADTRRLGEAFDNQRGPRGWPKKSLREDSRLLRGQTVLIAGLGAIGLRLAELLAPFGLEIVGVRRSPRGNEPIWTVPLADLDAQLPAADFVINLFPGSAETHRLFDAARFARMKPGSVFINIGRGTTVDQDALMQALTNGTLSAAYLDVTDPEPLPSDHGLWRARNCHITPHAAGGHRDEPDRLVTHFLANLARFRARQPLRDRVY